MATNAIRGSETHPVPSISVPPSLLVLIREVFRGSETGSGDAKHLRE